MILGVMNGYDNKIELRNKHTVYTSCGFSYAGLPLVGTKQFASSEFAGKGSKSG